MNILSPLKPVALLLAMAPFALAAQWFVAPSGNDAGPGTEVQPFATLERARDAARQANGSTVVLAPGTYRRTRTFELDERDSGTTYTGKDARMTGTITGTISRRPIVLTACTSMTPAGTERQSTAISFAGRGGT